VLFRFLKGEFLCSPWTLYLNCVGSKSFRLHVSAWTVGNALAEIYEPCQPRTCCKSHEGKAISTWCLDQRSLNFQYCIEIYWNQISKLLEVHLSESVLQQYSAVVACRRAHVPIWEMANTRILSVCRNYSAFTALSKREGPWKLLWVLSSVLLNFFKCRVAGPKPNILQRLLSASLPFPYSKFVLQEVSKRNYFFMLKCS